ncbi:transmembrane and TPR repeat-containing protein F38B6.6 [Geobacter sp. OR-1]|uniref:tetratricopeptide repeat protein n=1 Tax=Geobacter sp. OR-1 TaxID=1266765 RepID=UPI000541AC10|nr:tetratricopeptide repeat protein [Geobacter sp. OR-1]GAM08934.1 transmembrane and TPR repeat-containing protein F38B6.6 [Geobacter sp. OR-1]
MTTQRDRFSSDLTMVFLIAAVGVALYCRTLGVPWLFDDPQNIMDNPVVHDISKAFKSLLAVRGFAYLTFAVNYRFGGLDVTGYHLVNIGIHLCASWFVWLLAKRVFAEPDYRPRAVLPAVPDAVLLSAAASFLFLVHPIQTQSVNYIVQRMTTLSALLALVAIYAYCRARESVAAGSGLSTPAHVIWYLVSLLTMALACMTKQNAVLIPAEILLFDWLILNRGALPSHYGRRLAYLVPFLLVSALFIYLHVGKDELVLKEAGRADYWVRAEAASAGKKPAPGQPALNVADLSKPRRADAPPENLQALYLATEMTVLWKYIRLLVLPYNQVFDYGYPLVSKVVTLPNLAAAAGHLLFAGLALVLARRRPLLSFGILWFYISLSVESSIIPLDAMVEHRLYLPMFGFAVAAVDLGGRFSNKRIALATLGLVIAGYAGAAMQRNLLWSNPIAFALDGRDKAPHNQRNHITLANAYADAGRWADAEAALRKAIPVRPYHNVPYDNLGVALIKQGKFSEARTWFSLATILNPEYPNAIYNYGYASLRLGDTPAAVRSLQRLRELRSPLAMQLGAQFMNN